MTSLRPATDADTEFLWEVQSSALGEYVTAQFGTTESQQRRFFDDHFVVEEHSVVVVGGRDAGFFGVRDEGETVYLGNVALLPSYQSRGLGTELVTGVLDDATRRDQSVQLQVLRTNPRARRFYERLGLAVSGGNETHVFMTSLPAGRAQQAR